MHQQNQIKRTLALPKSIDVVRTLLNSQAHKNRASLSRTVCQHFNFHDARGRPQIGVCVKALRQLERVGHFILPAQSKATVLKSPRRLDCAVPNPVAVPAQAGDVQGLCLIKVDRLDLMRIWNEMMIREHPQGAGPLVGCQLRCLIASDHGWLGGFAFSAAALNLRDRDQWTDKDVQQRREHLHRVLLHSTFVVSTEGLPLGLLQAQFSAPQPKSEIDTRPAASIPIEEKKTHLLD